MNKFLNTLILLTIIFSVNLKAKESNIPTEEKSTINQECQSKKEKISNIYNKIDKDFVEFKSSKNENKRISAYNIFNSYTNLNNQINSYKLKCSEDKNFNSITEFEKIRTLHDKQKEVFLFIADDRQIK